MINIRDLIDEQKCYEVLRQLRWPKGVACVHCGFHWVTKQGFHDHQPYRQRYLCQRCGRKFDDLSASVFEGHRQPLKVWVLCLYFMGLNLSNQQIGQELDVNKDDVQEMTTTLRTFMKEQREPVRLSGEVEADEVYVIAGHKGQPAAVQAQGRPGRRNRLKAKRGRGTLATEKPPIFGMLQRSGALVIEMLANVQQTTIQPLLQATVQPGSIVYTDDYSIYDRLTLWGYCHKRVNHSTHEFARDEDGDGFHEVHTNSLEGVWSLLRSWLRPHRGISQEKLPLYLAFFEFVHNTRKRGKALLPALLAAVLPPCYAY